MATALPPQPLPQAPNEQQQAAEAQDNAITGIPAIDTALMDIMQMLPKQAAPQLEALVQALEATLGGQQQMPQGQEGVM